MSIPPPLPTAADVDAAAQRLAEVLTPTPLHRSERLSARRRHRAVAVMVAGHVQRHELTRLGLDDSVLWSALRGAGVRTPDEVALVVVEPDGRFTVLRTGEEVHPAALTGVRHSGELLERLATAD